jgi:hydrogenase expression/formation protein HypE
MMSQRPLPVGKLPPELLARLIARAPVNDPRVRVRPGIGLDCAVVDLGDRLLVFKSDPITFATDEIGWYLVQVNANDLATTGAVPRWLLLTMLLPEGQATPALVEQWAEQVNRACRELGIDVIGGHTEVTHGLDRPILAGTLVGEAEPQRLVTPSGAQPGDRLLLTKGVPIEATALLAREFPDRLEPFLSPAELAEAQHYLTLPGLSIVRDAALALQAGRVSAMHDPTEGGLSGALWELAEACGHTLGFDPARVPVPPLAARVCAAFGLDPLAAIASGALLMTAPPPDGARIVQALVDAGLVCVEIGAVEPGPAAVWRATPDGRVPLARPTRDAVARLFDRAT